MTTVTTLKLQDLKPSATNVREYDSTQIDQLAKSIDNVGVLQSLLVTPNGKGYEVVAGGRRLAALRKLKFKGDVPVQIVEGDNLVEASLSENLYRRPLEDHEIWRAIVAMNNDKAPTVKEARAIAKRMHFTADEVRQAGALAKCHPDLVQLYIDNQIQRGVLEAITVLPDQEDQLKLIEDLKAEKDGYFPAAYEVRRAVGFADYQVENKIEYLGGVAAAQKLGVKLTTDLFSDKVIVHNPTVLNAQYYQAVFKADEAKAKRIGNVMPLTVDEIEADGSLWEQTYVSKSYATEQDEERADEIAKTLREARWAKEGDDDWLSDDQFQALADEKDALEMVYEFDEGRKYGLHNGTFYIAAEQTEAQDEAAPRKETVVSLSTRAIDELRHARQTQMRRTIMTAARDTHTEALRAAFVLGRMIAHNHDPIKYSTHEVYCEDVPEAQWQTIKDPNAAWKLLTDMDEEARAKSIANVWTAMFTAQLEPSFATGLASELEEVPYILDDHEFSRYHKKELLKPIAEEMGIDAGVIDANTLKDCRKMLQEKATKLEWRPPEVRFK